MYCKLNPLKTSGGKSIVAVGFLLIVIVLTGTGCHVILPLSARAVEEMEHTYFCSAQIYRPLPGGAEFTEEWQSYIWPIYYDAGQNQWIPVDPYVYATQKINEYIATSMAPGFSWNYRNLTVVQTIKELAVDCRDSSVPLTYGAPLGAEIRWNYPPPTEASVSVWLRDKDGVIRTANPNVATAYLDFAERTGYPSWQTGGNYQRLKKHIRFSDMFMEIQTPFALGSDMTVTKLYVQSIGTVYAESFGYDHTIYQGKAKFFFFGEGTKDGEDGVSSFCFENTSNQGFRVIQGPAVSSFAMGLNLTASDLGQDMQITLSLSKPTSTYAFKNYQPYVDLLDKQFTSPMDLVPDIVADLDNNLDKLLWFENFEAANEIYLGQGNPLQNVMFTDGDHEVTVVAYDTYGSYNCDTMILTPFCGDPAQNLTWVDPYVFPGIPGIHTVNLDVAEAIVAPGTPRPSCTNLDIGHAVWFSVTPAYDGAIMFTTCTPTTSYDTVVAAYNVSYLGPPFNQWAFVELDCNDDDYTNSNCSNACGDNRGSTVIIEGQAGVEYHFLVGSYNQNANNCRLCLDVELTLLPSCWSCPGQPFGDTNGDGYVNFGDLINLKKAFNTSSAGNPHGTGAGEYNCCVDFDHNGLINFSELITLKEDFNTSGYGTCADISCP